MLLSSQCVTMIGKAKKAMWDRAYKDINIRFIKESEFETGNYHTVRWGPNEITGEKSGGPPRVMFLDMTPRS